MKLEKKLLIKKWLSLILVFLLMLTSVNITSYASTDGGSANGGPGGNIPSSTGKGGRNILRSYGAMIGIHRNPNTGAAYSDIINAHNTGMTNGKVWDECLFSCVEQNLYKYPQHFLSQGCVENNAVILLNKNTNPVTKPLHYVTDTGAISEKPFCNYYVAKRLEEGNLTWSPIVIRDRIESDPKLLHAFQTYSLDIDVVKSLVASSQMDANIAAFVSLWGRASNVSKTINSMYKEGPEYYYDNLLKYLDLLCIVNEMCNGAYWDEIEDFLRTLNQDGSSDFISVYAASLVWVQPTNVTSVYTLFTLPNYYGACTGLV